MRRPSSRSWPVHLEALTAAVETWRVTQPGDPVAPPAPVEAVEPVATPGDPGSLVEALPVPEPVARPWVDLATNRPGAEAREQAVAARDAAPVKTVFARVLGLHTDERAWRIGADGEEKVA